jgi:hypothetical protein
MEMLRCGEWGGGGLGLGIDISCLSRELREERTC